MATRPVFLPLDSGDVLVRTEAVEFAWYPGMAKSQKQRSVASLHEAAVASGVCRKPLEVSSKSEVQLGVQLSAFNLSSLTPKGRRFTVESAFQSSKVFEAGGPYRDLLYAQSIDAKRDERLRDSGRLLHFDFFGQIWDLEPRTAFYDWLYIKTLMANPALLGELDTYDAFTDIEFNPQRSINCQAYAVAVYLALHWRGIARAATKGRDDFLACVGHYSIASATEDTSIQPRLV